VSAASVASALGLAGLEAYFDLGDALATRDPKAAGVERLDGLVEHGASPRASIALMNASKAHAFLQGRQYVTPHDVKSMAMPVLRHRVAVSYEAEAEGMNSEDVIQKILDSVLVP